MLVALVKQMFLMTLKKKKKQTICSELTITTVLIYLVKPYFSHIRTAQEKS